MELLMPEETEAEKYTRLYQRFHAESISIGMRVDSFFITARILQKVLERFYGLEKPDGDEMETTEEEEKDFLMGYIQTLHQMIQSGLDQLNTAASKKPTLIIPGRFS